MSRERLRRPTRRLLRRRECTGGQLHEPEPRRPVASVGLPEGGVVHLNSGRDSLRGTVASADRQQKALYARPAGRVPSGDLTPIFSSLECPCPRPVQETLAVRLPGPASLARLPSPLFRQPAPPQLNLQPAKPPQERLSRHSWRPYQAFWIRRFAPFPPEQSWAVSLAEVGLFLPRRQSYASPRTTR